MTVGHVRAFELGLGTSAGSTSGVQVSPPLVLEATSPTDVMRELVHEKGCGGGSVCGCAAHSERFWFGMGIEPVTKQCSALAQASELPTVLIPNPAGSAPGVRVRPWSEVTAEVPTVIRSLSDAVVAPTAVHYVFDAHATLSIESPGRIGSLSKLVPAPVGSGSIVNEWPPSRVTASTGWPRKVAPAAHHRAPLHSSGEERENHPGGGP